LVSDIPGGTSAQYDAVIRALGDSPLDGNILHVAAPSETGWRVVDVWESQEKLQRFFEQRLGAALASAGVTPNEPKVRPVHVSLARRGADLSKAVTFCALVPGTLDQYDQILEKGGLLDAEGQPQLPPGQIVHACADAAGEGGFVILDVWESVDALGAFMQGLGPVLESVGITGFQPPTPQPVHHAVI
jgi:hypothetical protein